VRSTIALIRSGLTGAGVVARHFTHQPFQRYRTRYDRSGMSSVAPPHGSSKPKTAYRPTNRRGLMRTLFRNSGTAPRWLRPMSRTSLSKYASRSTPGEAG
jgi:hypothetical protein